jgi:eukaryotic-like serine/threonine-protein kinase
MTEMQPGMLLKSRYKVLEQLGKGGMGEVYLAMDETLDTKVAVKANHNLSQHTSSQFIREAKLLASLKHPNLPRVIDYFTENDSQYLVMDFIPGENLKELVESKKQFTFEQIKKWATQLGHALTYLHTQEIPIYHRDIKPANIKVTPSGDVVLVDFGIAKTGDASMETQTGAWAFSPGFAPPEQVSGMRTGPYSDQFSLASTIYYLFAGKPPADSARRLMGEEEYITLNKINASIPAHFAAAIDKALSVKPEARFATVAGFVEALTNPKALPETESAQKTVMINRTPVPPPVQTPFNQPGAGDSPVVRKKSSTVWLILGLLAFVGVVIGGFMALKAMGIIGKPAVIVPTATLEAQQGNVPTNTIEAAANSPTATIEPATPTATITPTSNPAAFIPIGNGGKVAFISDRQGDGYQQVWVMDVGYDGTKKLVGQNLQQLTFSTDNKSNPAWSPDGTKIIYSGWSTQMSVNGSSFADDIWMIDITQPDTPPVDLSLRVGDDRYAAWSPTNKLIAFTSYYREDKTPQLVVMNPDGSKQELLSIMGFSDTYATWSPNGDWLLYTYSTGELQVLQMISLFNIVKKSPRTLQDFQKFDRTSNEGRLGNVSEPAFSFDGSMLAYSHVFGGRSNIFAAVYSDRGRTSTQLTDTGKDSAPCWSSDNKWILFTSERDGDPEIYIMDAAGGNQTNLTQFSSTDKDPAWQPIVPQK